jgi:lysophospholipase L1-like esterase
MICALMCFVSVLLSASAGRAGLPAFPGAEGFGAVAVGGRGGKVIKVTTLASSGPGSLQAACAEEGPRLVVFDVGGVVRGDVAIKHPFITIAGQTAPSPGITIEGRLLARPEPWRRLNDIVVRFIRIRPAPTTGHTGDAVQLPDTERVVLDHLSMSWANDETIDICHSSEVTIQWCTLEESDTEGHAKGGGHNFGLISAYPNSGSISLHHNLFAHHSRRSPSLTPYVPGKPGDFRNNVVYNFREGLTHDGHVPQEAINFVGNYYKRGPSSETILPFNFHPEGRYYLEGNFVDGVGLIADGRTGAPAFPAWLQVNWKGILLTKPAPVAQVATHPAQEAYDLVLGRAGCFPRDRVTTRIIREVVDGTGKWGRNAPADPGDEWFSAELKRDAAAADSDGDGMPDEWEDTHGFSKVDKRDYNHKMPSGYTAIEEYINARAELLVKSGAEGAKLGAEPGQKKLGGAGAKGDEIVIIGASYVRAWPVQELGGMRVVNKGINGEQSFEMLQRFPDDVIALKPKAVIIWGFINDVHRTKREDIDAAMAKARESIAEMVRLAQANGIEPILATEVTIRGKDDLRSTVAGWVGAVLGKTSYQEYVNNQVLETNRWIRNHARENSILLLDFQPLIADEKGFRKKEFATEDGTHISAAAYEKLTAYAQEVFAAARVRK